MTKNLEELTVVDVLRELVQDVELAYGEPSSTEIDPQATAANCAKLSDWPDIAETYLRAKHVLAKAAMMRWDSEKSLGITKWYRTGETSGECNNLRDLLDEMGNLLNSACAADIFGDVLFQTEDGVDRIASVEGVISQVNPEYLRAILENAADAEDPEDEDDSERAD